MASERLTNYERDQVRKTLVREFSVKLTKKEKDLSDKASKFILENLVPTILLKAYEKFPKSFYKEKSIRIKTKEHFSTNIDLNIPNYSYSDSVGEDFSNYLDKKYKIEIKEIQKLVADKIILNGKIKCSLQHITTHNKLKDEFPEAYEILYDLPKGESGKDACSSLEELRAQLNSIKSK